MAGNAKMRRIVIVGKTGSGKTTLATDLSTRLGVPRVELDALFWDSNWTPVDISIFRERATIAVSSSAWVVDGNYSQVRDIVWPKADTLVWLDFPLILVLWRLLRRTIRRSLSRELLWGTNNRETLRNLLRYMLSLDRNSLFRQSVRMHRKHRREYPGIVHQPEYAHLNLIRLKTPKEVRRWLQTTFVNANNTT